MSCSRAWGQAGPDTRAPLYSAGTFRSERLESGEMAREAQGIDLAVPSVEWMRVKCPARVVHHVLVVDEDDDPLRFLAVISLWRHPAAEHRAGLLREPDV
jgi:hypothetical protein